MDQLIISTPNSSSPSFSFPLKKNDVLIGRQSHCDLVLKNNSVSREHAKLERKDGRWFIEDLQSRNGVRINGKRISYDPVQLHDRDLIEAGDVKITFHEDERAAAESGTRMAGKDAFSWRDDDDLSSMSLQHSVFLRPGMSSASQGALDGAPDYRREIQFLENRIRVLLDFARILGKAKDDSDLLPRFLRGVLKLFPQAESACLIAPVEKDDGKSVWELLCCERRREDSDEKLRVSRSLVKHVVATKMAVITDAPGRKSGALMVAPIYDATNDEVMGVIQTEAHRAFVEDDLRLFAGVASQVAVYWENQRFRDAVVHEKLAVQEMQVANQIQRGFLPLEPPGVDGYQFFDYYRPARYVGGDYFDYVPLPDGTVAIMLGDVAGKGITASLLMAKLSAEARCGFFLADTRAGAIARLNSIISEGHWGGRFITFVMLLLYPRSGELRIFNAGHLYPLLSRTDGTVVRLGEDCQGFPLGVMPDSEFPEFSYRMQPGESIALMSDGFTDAMNARDETFNESRVREALSNPDGDDADTIGRRLVDAVKKFSAGTNQTDDQCLVVLKRAGAGESRSGRIAADDGSASGSAVERE